MVVNVTQSQNWGDTITWGKNIGKSSPVNPY